MKTFAQCLAALDLHRTASAAADAAVASGAARSGAGLVSVPTSSRAAGGGLSASVARAAASTLASDVGAFVIDKAARRLSSLRMAVGSAARAHAVSLRGVRDEVCHMVTLTYRPGVHWEPKHISEALKHWRKWCKGRGIAPRYVWIAEIQDGKRRADGCARNVIHYHVAMWLPPHVKSAPHFDSRGWWPHGMTQSQAATHAVSYLMHYLKKDKDLSAMPKGARAYGVGGLDHSLRRARRWLRLPSFVQGNSSIHDEWERAEGGGWTAPTGHHYASEFVRTVVAGCSALVRVVTHATAIEAAGPFSWITDRERAQLRPV